MTRALVIWLASLLPLAVSGPEDIPVETAEPGSETTEPGSETAEPGSETAEPAEVEANVSVIGTITTQAAPSTETLEVTQDHPVCGDAVPSEVVVVADGKLANAVVFIDGIEVDPAPEPVEAVLDQVGCIYIPHVQALPVGSNITVVNSDDVLHNTHAFLGGSRTIFNLAMPQKDQRISRPLRRAGLVDVRCDAGHTWMSAYIYVFDHPYYAVTGGDGTYTLRDVPPGTYTLTVWHEKLETQSREITVAPDAPVQADFEL
ncbi:MAG: carboxypeptidase regulatory-like domain-containing protein [Deltaproteobacteria bacterium]|nr:carboxypeptidase regulatory-like domain-containing protein [Deltaproteobacteria bacterium]